MSVLEVKFVGDEDVLEHIVDVDKKEAVRANKGLDQKIVTFKSSSGRRARRDVDYVDDDDDDGDGGCGSDEDEILNEQKYVQALGTECTTDTEELGSGVAGAAVFSFQKNKRSHGLAQRASELARTPGKSVTFSGPLDTEPATPVRSERNSKNDNRTPQKGRKVKFVSTTPHRLWKRHTAPSLRSDSDSELSPSDSEEGEEGEGGEGEKGEGGEGNAKQTLRTPSKDKQSAALYKTPAKRSRNLPEATANQPSLIEEYFEAHSSTKVVTSDRTLQRLQTPKLDRETLFRLLENTPSSYSSEIQRIHGKHQKYFSKWMLQLQLGFSVLVYGLGSKKALLEDFRLSQLSQELHLVVNGFFPSITLKSILNAVTSEALDHQGSFRSPSDQIDFITKTLRDSPDLHIYLLVHNIDGPMLRGEKTQATLGHLASIPNLHLVASIDHINAPLVWDQSKHSQFNWLWWECVTYQRYVEETSYENSLLVQQTGALALSSLTHVLRSLTSNARGIFKILVQFQLENKDNTSYIGLSFQDFYQRCREAFLVNSDLTLRTQLTEFRDHKLIRTRKGADGVEYLIVPVDTSTLLDFLEKEEGD